MNISIEEVEKSILKEEYMKVGTKMTVCLLTLKNGHEVIGVAGIVDAFKFDLEIGSKVAKRKAIDEVWSLMGYALQVELHKKK